MYNVLLQFLVIWTFLNIFQAGINKLSPLSNVFNNPKSNGRHQNIVSLITVLTMDTEDSILALLNHFAIRRGYAIPNFCIVRLRCSSCRHKLFVQTLLPQTFMDRLVSNFT